MADKTATMSRPRGPAALSDRILSAVARRFSDRTMNLAIRVLAVTLPIALIVFGAFYWLDRHPAPGPTLEDRAVAEAEQAVRESPNDVALRNHLGAAYVSADRLQDGIEQFTLVLDAAASNRPALLGRGLAYMQQENYDAAVADFTALIDVSQGEFSATDPQLEHAYYELGVAELARGNAAAAVAAERAALAIDGGDADALYTFGVASIETGDATNGVAALRRAVQFVPTGWCEPYQGLERGYSALGDAVGTSYAAAMLDLCEGRVDEARPALQSLATGPMRIDALLGLAVAAQQSGDTTAAMANYREVLAFDPENASARIGLSLLGATDGPASTTTDTQGD